MARRARKRAAPMDWLARVDAELQGTCDAELLAGAAEAREQVELLRRYRATCEQLEAFGADLQAKGPALVPFRFPVRPTQKNRQAIEEGLLRSFTRFMDDLHVLCRSTSTALLERSSVEGECTALTQIAVVLQLESCRVLDRQVTATEARATCVHFLECMRRRVVHDECVGMRALRDACGVVSKIMAAFSKRLHAQKRGAGREATVAAARAWLKTAARQGLSHAVHTLCRSRRMAAAFDAHAWLTKQYVNFSDAEVVAVWERMRESHVQLLEYCNWESRRIDWLSATSACNACWDGLVVSPSAAGGETTSGGPAAAAPTAAPPPEGEWALSGAVVQAPAHQGVFASSERVRLVGEPPRVAFSCHLSTVRAVAVVLELLTTKRLLLHKIGSEYARRIAAYDYSKYESAGQHILADTLVPFGVQVGVACDL